jgi:hypothetical protein
MDAGTHTRSYYDVSHETHYFLFTNFTADGEDHELDLSSHVPAGARAVNIQVRGRSSDGEGIAFMRIPGAQPTGTCHVRPQIAEKNISMHTVIGLDSTRKVIYKLSGGTWTDFVIRIKGYFR